MGKFVIIETMLISQRPTSLSTQQPRNCARWHYTHRLSPTGACWPVICISAVFAPAGTLSSVWQTGFAAVAHVLGASAAPGRSNTSPSPCTRDHGAMPQCLCPTFYFFGGRTKDMLAASDRTHRWRWDVSGIDFRHRSPFPRTLKVPAWHMSLAVAASKLVVAAGAPMSE
ncbi:hypothetical protein DE146DRAFT_197500 [Phaeosphaeria sp. MPI-PUGE-AT-0046c]|nr:hypothetical protein DE146DRAFT_197500 [Phaeosphaeria sp. MPI-PUGE-AT-0046c]